MLSWLRSMTDTARRLLTGVGVSSCRGAPGAWRGAAGNISWAVKLTELEPGGTRYVDPDAAADWTWLRRDGKYRIAYVFGHPSVSAAETVDYFLAELGTLGLEPSDGVSLDLEVTDGRSPAEVSARAAAVMADLASKLKRTPVPCTFLSLAREGNCAALGRFPLWIADPSSRAGHPQVPPPWRTWAIHQHDISGSIDRDLVRCCSWKRQTAARAGPERRAGPPARTDRAAPTWRLSCIFRGVSSRPAPRNLRASDADRDRVAALLSEAAGDGRLTLGEHSQRAEQAYSARTLGELASLTADLAAPAAQPIRLDGRRSVAGIFGQDRREGRWVVPESFPVTAICGDVVLDLREALLQSSRVTIYATVIAGQLKVMVPDGVAVEVTGTTILSRNKVPRAPQPVPGVPVIEIRLFAVAGTVKAVMPRRSRWPSLRRRGPVPRS
jgi:hypothetical protein